MRIEELRIDMLPGIEPGFSVRFPATGVTLVTGPNGIGKSSLLRAMRWLLTPPRAGDPVALALAADWRAGPGMLSVRRQGSAVEWRRNGETAVPPRLPDPGFWHCYWLSVESLLAADQGDDRLDKELRRLMAGGFDLAKVRKKAGLDLGARFGRAEAARLREARREQRRIEDGYEALRREEEALPGLLERLQAARAAGRKVERRDRALEWLRARDERRRAAAALADHPEGMSRLRGDELERLEQLRTALAARQGECQAAARERDQAAERLRATGLEAGQPGDDLLRGWAEELQRAEFQRDQLGQHRERLQSATADCRRALAGLGTGQEGAPDLSPEAVSAAEQLARELQSTDLRHRELVARIRQAPPEPSLEVIRGHGEAGAALREWLQARASVMPGRWRVALGVAGAGVVLALVAGVRAADWWVVAGAGTALAALGWVWLRLLGDDEPRRARARFEATGLVSPAGWGRSQVEARLHELEAEVLRLEQQRDEAREARRLEAEAAEYARRLRDLGEAKTDLAGRLGFDPDLTALGFDRFVRLVQDWQSAGQERDRARALVARGEAALQRLQAELAAFLEPWQDDTGGADRAWRELEAGFRELQGRCREATEARRAMAAAARELEFAREGVKELEARIAGLFTDAGVAAGDENELRQRVERLDPWRQLDERLREARAHEQAAATSLENALAGGGDDAGGLRKAVDQERRDLIEQQRAEAAELAGQVDSLQQQVTELRTRLADAGHDRALEAAAARVDQAGAELDDAFEQAREAVLGGWLLDKVERAYRQSHEPDVLRRARERFKAFTHNAYDIDWQPDDGFRARDLLLGQWRALGQLSSGARMQLLLAVRLAWVEHLDRDREGLPVCLDEALTTTDDERLMAVAASLHDWSRGRGRQVIYLSARRHEIALWQRACEDGPGVIDLAEVRFGQDGEPPALELPSATALPAPGGLEAVDYARQLGVAAIDPRLPSGRVPVFHLLRDHLALLHRLMDHWRVTALGPLESLLNSSAGPVAVDDPGWRRRLRRRCAIARTWCRCWRMGRGRPVDRPALERSGAVSETFMDRVADLADELAGDGAALVAALRAGKVARFREDNINRLDDWLVEQGHIDQREVLDAKGRVQRTLEQQAAESDPEEIRRVVRFLEAGLADGGGQG